MQLQTNEFAGSISKSGIANILITALHEKQAASVAPDDFTDLDASQISDIAANAAGFYRRERSWMAVEHLCALALEQALELVSRRDEAIASN